jgi:hypothetical protein
VYLPRPVSDVAAKRIEDEVVLQFKVPTVNTDNTGPADLRRIEVYAHTGALPKPEDFVKYGTLVASIPIKQPPRVEEQKAETGAPGAVDVAGATSPSGDSSTESQSAKLGPRMVEQGWTTTVREALTPKHMEPGPMPPTRPVVVDETEKPVVIEKLETPGTINFELPPQRFYALVGVSDSRGRRGPFAGPIPVPLLEPLTAPEKIDVEYNERAISLIWPGTPQDVAMTKPVGLSKEALGLDAAPAASVAPEAPSAPAGARTAPLPPIDRETDGTIEFFADVETEGTRDVLVAVTAPATTGAKPKPTRPLVPQPPPTPRFGYNVYEAAATSALPEQTAAVNTPSAPDVPSARSAPDAPITPLNAALLTAPGFADPRVEFGVERCYVVRRVEMVGSIEIESAPSAPACVKPVDTFPPAPPKSLQHIAAANGVTLLWEANTEADLGGYVVLRGEAPGDKLSPLTKEPIAETSFVDTTARRGRTYIYRVVAVDRSTPPNRSEPSAPVEETIR